VWIETPDDERRIRLRQRADWPTYAPFVARWERQETGLQARAHTRDRADLVVDGRDGTDALDPSLGPLGRSFAYLPGERLVGR
jgi:hypothetical protein